MCGFVVERIWHDYGIDLEIMTFNDKGEVEEGKILFQLKSSEQLKPLSDHTVAVRVNRMDLLHWLAQPMPVILIVYDASKDVAYWLYVQGNARRFDLFAGQTVAIRIPISNVVNPRAMMKFARFRDRVLAQMDKVEHDEN